MRMRLGIVALGLLSVACSGAGSIADIQAGSLEIGIDSRGWVVSFVDPRTGREYLPRGHEAPLLTLRVDDLDVEPVAAAFGSADSILVLEFENGLEARIRVRTRDTHATFELVSVADAPSVEESSEARSADPESTSNSSAVDLAIWGPYPTTIGETIGETVGVVRGQEFAMGLQSLNPRTLGGYPWNENDAMPQLDIFESGDYSDLSEEGKRYVLYRVEAAKPDSFGSTLQAYTRNRNRERIIPNWGHERYTAPPFDDGGIVGSKIALFGCRVDDALATVGAIEVAEGLPHPTIDGEWGKEARSASAAYVILPFSESSIDEAVDVTLQAGLRYLYHSEPFETWGHFELNDDFPKGVEGLRAAVQKAESRGVHVGAHTLSNFITTNDPYVTPVPDPRLARVGTTLLTEDIGPADTELGIESPEFFDQFENNHLRAAVVGGEIVRYRAVSEAPSWRLLDVERGAFGTRPGVHETGDSIGKLADHGYRVFLSDAGLTVEMATTVADLYNRTGLRQISFDGLEGNRSTGMGNYGEILFTTTWYDALNDDIRTHFIADASRTSHYFWHIYSRMNWGEPWYAGFRESQTEYRLKNQAYFRRNMMPGMLGWFRMQPVTSVEDIEWMLARSAAFDAGYAFVTSFEALEGNGRSDEILRLIGMWEEARMADAFTPEQKHRMEDIGNEFHLEEVGEGGWNLYQIHSSVLRYDYRERQPGEPSHQAFTFRNPEGEQSLRFVLTAVGASVDGVRMELDGVGEVDLGVRLRDGEALVYEGGDRATVYSSQWRVLGSVPMDSTALNVGPGEHRLLLDAAVEGEEGAHLKVELRIRGEVQSVRRH
ncbi:hypothetical protein ACGF5M_04120 [Gemmatimonadota bacterium]